MRDWPLSDPNYKKFIRYFGEFRPFKDDDPKRLMRSMAMRDAYAMYNRHASLRSSGRQLMTTATGYNQALVKVIPNGGATSAKGLRDQVAYLTRQHTLKMSESDLGPQTGELEKQEALQKVNEWSETFRGNPKFGHTTHVLVSFPKGTDPVAAKRAGEEFADRAFSQGLGGDCFDYMAIQHTDTEYPHTHIVVRNRGLYESTWFTIRRGSAHEPSVLRALQAEVSAKFGIQLSATTRLERGIKEKPVLTPEYRLAKAEGRVPRPKPISELEDVVLDALIDDRAEAYSDLAETLEDKHEDLKQALVSAAALLKKGGFVVPKTMSKDFDAKTTDELIKVLDAEKAELDRQLKRGVENVKYIKNAPTRAAFEAELGLQMAVAAKHFPEREEYKIFARGENIDAFREAYQFDNIAQISSSDAQKVGQAYEGAERNIRTKAQAIGINADEVLARYKVTSSVRHETARRWHLGELRDVTENRSDLDPEGARTAVVEFHEYVRDQFKAANLRIAKGLRAQGVQVTSKETPLPKHALKPFDEILSPPRPKPRPADELKNKPRPTI